MDGQPQVHEAGLADSRDEAALAEHVCTSLCQQARQLCDRFCWSLVSPCQLAQRAEALMRAGLASAPDKSIIGAYCLVWHAACSGSEGDERYEHAYDELGDYLHGLAGTRFKDLTRHQLEDATQATLLAIIEGFADCRQPIAFLSFAINKLRDNVRPYRRQNQRREVALEPAGPDDTTAVLQLSAPGADPVEEVVATEHHQAIRHFLAAFLEAHPRAKDQVEILRLQLLEELDDATIALRLKKSLNSVHKARSLALRRIRTEPVWWERAREFGLLPPER